MKTKRIHPQKFALWLGIGSIIMMFAGLTSAYIVRKAAGNWVDFKLPDWFWISTLVIVASSATLYWAHRAFLQKNEPRYTQMLGLTFLLGCLFMGFQYAGWQELQSYGILLNGNPSGAFVYVISGLHVAHVLGGLVFLGIFFFKSLNRRNEIQDLMHDINPHRSLSIDLLSTYWHFVDVLWLYLFGFFLLFH